MGEFVGYNLSYNEICDVRNRNMRSIADSYREATAYFYALRDNEESIRNIDAILYLMRGQIQEAKANKKKR